VFAFCFCLLTCASLPQSTLPAAPPQSTVEPAVNPTPVRYHYGTDPQAHKPQRARSCVCSGACTCGCNDGQPCRCGAPQTVALPPATAGAAAPASFYRPAPMFFGGGFGGGACRGGG
jgi:hypothetical protein